MEVDSESIHVVLDSSTRREGLVTEVAQTTWQKLVHAIAGNNIVVLLLSCYFQNKEERECGGPQISYAFKKDLKTFNSNEYLI